MRQAGEITYTNTHHQRPGEGVVEFGSRSDMEYALDKLDGEEVDGRRIKLVEESRGRSRSRSRSRRSRSRSRRSRSRSRRSRSRSDRSRSKSKSRRSRSRSRS
ncbi:serine/arginine-rich splicing factor 6 [Eurytemora carolleeae]|uniref:serine/arginine-rich splicing factor 6 n=1 Tax=Eurytemora carolleeae TaxID=1294199 RepID=UPI000C773AD3|nr:serine/arginine-rich splicing factor 6 [Eurytemora carolleeae]|eukprot:XP_023341753.1 serine/arginine-rich splicing factor 6-like [Eurytemora affinis]